MRAQLIAVPTSRANCVVTLDTSGDYELGKYHDELFYRWPRGHRVRLGLPGEYAGALAAKGRCVPERWPALPRSIVVCRQNGPVVERAFIPERFAADGIESWLAGYDDHFGLWRAKQRAERDPHIIVDSFRLEGCCG